MVSDFGTTLTSYISTTLYLPNASAETDCLAFGFDAVLFTIFGSS
jgi:hypothetical protein